MRESRIFKKQVNSVYEQNAGRHRFAGAAGIERYNLKSLNPFSSVHIFHWGGRSMDRLIEREKGNVGGGGSGQEGK